MVSLVRGDLFFYILKTLNFEMNDLSLTGDHGDRAGDPLLVHISPDHGLDKFQTFRRQPHFLGIGKS